MSRPFRYGRIEEPEPMMCGKCDARIMGGTLCLDCRDEEMHRDARQIEERYEAMRRQEEE